MAHSNLLGSDEIPVKPPGHDTRDLGPSDSSDSGSDVAGLAGRDDGDPGLPVDIATGPDSTHPDTSFESVTPGADSDAGGTGERRSAAGDAGPREGADIGPDNVVPDPDSDPGVDDNSPIFEDFPNEDEGPEEVPEAERRRDKDSDSLDYNNAVFGGRDDGAPARPGGHGRTK